MKLIKGRDYYIEKGKYVFTEYFLKNRGWCCENGCRNCPYKKEKVLEIGLVRIQVKV